MYGIIRKISPYTNRKAWKLQIEIDDMNLPKNFRDDPWSIAEIPVDVTECGVTGGDGIDGKGQGETEEGSKEA